MHKARRSSARCSPRPARCGLVTFVLTVAFDLTVAIQVGVVLAAFLFSLIIEYPGATEGGGNAIAEAVKQLGLIRRDTDLRRFLIVRTLLLSTALVAPFYVALASRESGGQVSQLGGMLVASGAAGFVSAPVWGRFSDRSSRKTMAAAAALAALAGFATVFVVRAPGLPDPAALFRLVPPRCGRAADPSAPPPAERPSSCRTIREPSRRWPGSRPCSWSALPTCRTRPPGWRSRISC